MDHHMLADRWVADIKKDEGEKSNDPTFCAIQSRNHLLYLMVYTGELITVAKGVRRRMTVIMVLLILCFLGIISPVRY